MQDIFENTILCNHCNKKMKPELVTKNGFNLRTVKCDTCPNRVIHPMDKREYEEFMRLKQKEYNVKMRMVGNSYAVSIPKEIVDFMQEQEKMMNDMVKLCFEEAGRISLAFDTEQTPFKEEKQRIVKSEEVRVVRNGKPVYHVKKFLDSANPKNNQTNIFKEENKKSKEARRK